MQIIVNDLALRYESMGSGKTIVLLHGWGDDLDTFETLAQELSKGYTVVSLDLPGFGDTETPSTTWNLSDYATFVKEALTKLGFKDIYAFIGHSNGGAIAVYGLGNKLFASDKLVLLASSGIRKKSSFKKATFKFIARVGRGISSILPRRIQRRLREKLYKAAGSDYLVKPELAETFIKVTAQDIRNDASDIQVPTLLLYGYEDTATPSQYGEMLADKIEKSQLEVIEGAGHFIHHDKPEEVLRNIKVFLSK